MAISSGFGVVLRFPRQMATARELLISPFWSYLPLDMYKRAIVRLATVICSPGMTSSCLVSHR